MPVQRKITANSYLESKIRIKKRSIEHGAEALIEAYGAYGIVADEDPFKGGDYGPYIQTERKEIYKKYADELIEKGHAYYCFALLNA